MSGNVDVPVSNALSNETHSLAAQERSYSEVSVDWSLFIRQPAAFYEVTQFIHDD